MMVRRWVNAFAAKGLGFICALGVCGVGHT